MPGKLKALKRHPVIAGLQHGEALPDATGIPDRCKAEGAPFVAVPLRTKGTTEGMVPACL
jgi:hypothetical protein